MSNWIHVGWFTVQVRNIPLLTSKHSPCPTARRNAVWWVLRHVVGSELFLSILEFILLLPLSVPSSIKITEPVLSGGHTCPSHNATFCMFYKQDLPSSTRLLLLSAFLLICFSYVSDWFILNVQHYDGLVCCQWHFFGPHLERPHQRTPNANTTL